MEVWFMYILALMIYLIIGTMVAFNTYKGIDFIAWPLVLIAAIVNRYKELVE